MGTSEHSLPKTRPSRKELAISETTNAVKCLKPRKERRLDEFKKITIEKHILDFIEANKLPDSEFEGIKSAYYRNKKSTEIS